MARKPGHAPPLRLTDHVESALSFVGVVYLCVCACVRFFCSLPSLWPQYSASSQYLHFPFCLSSEKGSDSLYSAPPLFIQRPLCEGQTSSSCRLAGRLAFFPLFLCAVTSCPPTRPHPSHQGACCAATGCHRGTRHRGDGGTALTSAFHPWSPLNNREPANSAWRLTFYGIGSQTQCTDPPARRP